MSEEILSTVNAEPEVAVEPQTTEVQETTNSTEPVQEPSVESEVAPTKPVQTAEENSKFAAIRRESERQVKEYQQRMDNFAKQYGYSDFAEMESEQIRQQREQEAQKLNVDPQFYNEFIGLKDKVSQFETEKQQLEQEKAFIQQETALKNDPATKDFYNQWESEIKEKAKAYGCDLDTAFTLKIRESLADITKGVATKAEQSAIQKITGNGLSSPGSLSGGSSDNGTKSAFAMSKDEFENLITRAKRGEKVNL
jgi:hypothetical protein